MKSDEGDGDIYVSTTDRYVDYSNYELHSATFGIEEIEISKDLKRPVFISIYAHPFNPKTVFVLERYLMKKINNQYQTVKELDRELTYEDYIKVINITSNKQRE